MITRKVLRLLPIAGFILLASAGCSTSPPAQLPAQAVGNADQLLASALHAWIVERDLQQARRELERAAAAAPASPEFVLLQLRLCALTAGCDSQPLEARFSKLAPDNAVVWLSVLARAQAERDTALAGQVLMAMGRGRRFDLYWTTLVRRVAAGVSARTARGGKNTPAPLTAALNDSISWLSTVLVPVFQPLSAACAPESVGHASLRTRCAEIAQLLQQGDSYLAEGVGLGVAQRLATPGGVEAAQIQERVEIIGYQNRTAAAVIASQTERERFSAEVLKLMQKLPREQDVSIAILKWASLPLDP